MFALRADDEVSVELAEEHHAHEIYDLVDRNRAHLRPWMPWLDATTAPEDTLAYLRSARADYAAGRAAHGNLRYRGVLVGGAGLVRIDRAMRTADVGYWIDADHTGRGIVTRATRALVAAAFEELGMVRVGIKADVDNERSRAVPERLGFAFEGVLRQNKRVGDRNVDHAVYGMVADDWRPGTLRGNDAGGT